MEKSRQGEGREYGRAQVHAFIRVGGGSALGLLVKAILVNSDQKELDFGKFHRGLF